MQKKNYKLTFAACAISSANQAVVANVMAVLFVTFLNLYQFDGVWQLGALVAVNFVAQLAADIILSFFIDKVPYRVFALSAVALSAAGLILFASLPFFLLPAQMFAGTVVATVVFSFSGGMLEVVTTPIVDSLPLTGNKGATVSFLHSFYAWGQVVCVAGTALFVFFAGAENWMYAVYFWALLPLTAFVIFLFSPMCKRPPDVSVKQKSKAMFSPYMLVAFLAIMLGGASEIIMNQYVSTFAKLGLGFSDVIADLVGMCLFALMLGIGRIIYAVKGEKINLGRYLSILAFITFLLYLMAGFIPVNVVSLVCCVAAGFTTSLLWPGTLVLASRRFPLAGAWIFALLAIFGDVGAAVFPLGLGFAADGLNLALGLEKGFRVALGIFSVVPLLCFFCQFFLYRSDERQRKLLNGKERATA